MKPTGTYVEIKNTLYSYSSSHVYSTDIKNVNYSNIKVY